jgi:hypothetical protein
MKRLFSHKSKLNVQGDGAITVAVPPWANRHQIVTEVVTASVHPVGTITVTVAANGINVGDTISLNGKTWKFSIDGARDWEIAIAATDAAQVTLIVAAINRDYGSNRAIGDAGFFVAADGAGDTVTCTWSEKGAAGNAIVFVESSPGIAMDGSGTLSSGVGTGVIESAAAGTGAEALWYHKSGVGIVGGVKDFNGVAAEYELVTGMLDKIVVTPTALTATSSFRVIVNSWKE